MMANIYLDAFGQEMKRRGHHIVRYVDDILIPYRSKTAALHIGEVATTFLEGDLRQRVNTDKTHLIHTSHGIKFLGVKIRLCWPHMIAARHEPEARSVRTVL